MQSATSTQQALPKLYHYTAPGGLVEHGIAVSNSLRLSHILFQNDKSEFIHAKNLFVEVIEQEYPGLSSGMILGYLPDGPPMYTHSL